MGIGLTIDRLLGIAAAVGHVELDSGDIAAFQEDIGLSV